MEKINSFTISGLPKIYFGNGVFSELIPIMKSFGKNCLLITGKESFLSSGIGIQFITSVSQTKLKIHKAVISGEPSPYVIDDIVKEFRKFPINAVVAIGGGSVIDGGKAISAMLAEEGSVEEYLEGVGTKKPSGVKAPFIAVPTTAGTGSEATKNAVLSNVGNSGYKKSLRHDNYIPDIALIDPELTLACPQALTASCGLDAIAQLFESYTSTTGNPFTDSLALSGLKYACHSFPKLIETGCSDLTLRGMMSYAAMISGITLSQAGLGTIHGIAGAAGGIIPVPHGIMCGLLLPSVVKGIVDKCLESGDSVTLEKIGMIGREISGEKQQDINFYCETVVKTFSRWVGSVQLPRLRIFGMTDEHIPLIVKNSDNKSSPVLFNQSQITEFLQQVM